MITLKAGGDVDAFCKRCQLELAHVIVAMAQGRVARVQCKTCHTVHAYRGGAASTRTRGEPSERAPRARTATRPQYDDLLRGHDISRARKYAPATTYSEGNVINHPTFGLGLIMRVLSDGKIEVLFPAGSKVLVHARG
jgi:hypothetical protein